MSTPGGKRSALKGERWSTKKKVGVGLGGLAGCGCLSLVGLLVLGLILAALGYDSDGTAAAEEPEVTITEQARPTPTPTETPTPEEIAEAGTALAMLYELEVKGRAPKAGYDHDLFGWRDDTDHNGCDTRNDVLRRDLNDLVLEENGCVVLDGTVTSPYSGETFDFTRGDDNNIDIDHLVSLSNAWQTGGQQLSDSERVEFGNDPLNLVAVESELNSQKSDGDAATWLPPNKGYRCEYVARQIAVKHKYGLWVVQPEKDAMIQVLSGCEGQEAFEENVDWPATSEGDVDEIKRPKPKPAPEPEPEREKAPAPAPEPEAPKEESGGSGGGPGTGPGGAYKNCTEARERGGAPVHRGESGYGKHLDRDGDGVGCE